MRPGLTRDIRPDAFARALAVLLLATALPEASASGPVTIYRCTASDGTVSVGNTPCAGGQRQEQRQMQRPQDPAPGTVREVRSTAEPAAPAAAPPREVRVVRVEPPQPMYACTTPDGERYLSDDDQGSARWVPLWVAGYAPARPHPPQGPRPGPPAAGGGLQAPVGPPLRDPAHLPWRHAQRTRSPGRRTGGHRRPPRPRLLLTPCLHASSSAAPACCWRWPPPAQRWPSRSS